MTTLIEIALLVAIIWLILRQQGGNVARFFRARHRQIVLDSCALIDGRVAEIVRTGFVADQLIIPQFIISELQLLADGNDSHKRERARYGLDVAHELQDSAPHVEVDREIFPSAETTDDKLIALAKKRQAQLFTTDYNLAKVAAVEGVPVLNVNELAQSLRPISLPGETLHIRILQKGSNRNQGVGYLDDGTMIVIEGAARHVGQVIPVTVTRMHQTVAGKMVFGELAKAGPEQRRQEHSNSTLTSRLSRK